MPRCGFTALSVRTRKKPHSDILASLVQIFWPLTTHSSPSSKAWVFRLARSEPALGSEKPWAQNSCPLSMGGRKRRFCASEPKAISTGATMCSPCQP